VAVASAGPYTIQNTNTKFVKRHVAVASSLHLAPDRKPRQHPTTQFFTGQVPILPLNQQRQSTEGQS